MAGAWIDGALQPDSWLPGAWYDSGVGPGDTTPPSSAGTPNITAITTNSATATWPAATDNVGVVGYEYRLNGGVPIDVGNTITTPLTLLTPGTTYIFEVRAYDLAGNRSLLWAGRQFDTLPTSTPNIPPSERTIRLLPSARRNLVS